MLRCDPKVMAVRRHDGWSSDTLLCGPHSIYDGKVFIAGIPIAIKYRAGDADLKIVSGAIVEGTLQPFAPAPSLP